MGFGLDLIISYFVFRICEFIVLILVPYRSSIQNKLPHNLHFIDINFILSIKYDIEVFNGYFNAISSVMSIDFIKCHTCMNTPPSSNVLEYVSGYGSRSYTYRTDLNYLQPYWKIFISN
ncbi:hypothetical protein WA026_006771 [Henosepilachna vigintioctopunctata]|uniref:Uncharacterized protein n=1 Tax=Henosepilachna vigintioctopunctata TaxID=420089 RepID=A0AAW1UG05_9CUCU